MDGRRTRLCQFLDETVGPVDGRYLRPWMTLGDPLESAVLLVGANAATPIPAATVDRDCYIEMLLLGGSSLRSLYERVRGDRGPSPTRRHIDRTTRILLAHGVGGVMETNVWALPTARLSDLRRMDPTLRRASETVLLRVITIVRPRVIVVHGAAATRGFSRCTALMSLLRSTAPDLLRPLFQSGQFRRCPRPAANEWLPAGWRAVEEMAEAIAGTQDGTPAHGVSEYVGE